MDESEAAAPAAPPPAAGVVVRCFVGEADRILLRALVPGSSDLLRGEVEDF
jgi:hypothetical protein